jgi:hypothetical protein
MALGLSRKRAEWSRLLPRPLEVPKVMKLRTLADVGDLLGRLPKETREKLTWQHVSAELAKASRGVDAADVIVVLSLEGVECRVG